jgi:hypothetical protein
MAIDASGAWYPVIPDVAAVSSTLGKLRHGSGPPDNAAGNNGDVWIDDLTSDLYVKTNGAWAILQGAPGGSGSGEAGVGSPEGVVTAPPGMTYVATDSNELYIKTSGVGNTGWVQFI